MANLKTSIEWTDATWSPVTGCSHVSPGCEYCYAEKLSLRRGWSTHPWGGQHAAENVVVHPERLKVPFHWKKPRRVFVSSMSDLFHEQIPDWFIFAVWQVMARTPQHSYQVLTKRPKRMREWLRKIADAGPPDVKPVGYRIVDGQAEHFAKSVADLDAVIHSGRGQMFHDWVASLGTPPHGYVPPTYDWIEGPRWWPTVLPNLWLGVSVEDQRRADERIPLLLDTPAAIRFLACEPLLGPVDLGDYLSAGLAGKVPLLDWVIGGGEWAGPEDRRLVTHLGNRLSGEIWTPKLEALAWARTLRDQCSRAGVAFFWKQWGGPTPKDGGRLLDGIEWSQFPTAEGVFA